MAEQINFQVGRVLVGRVSDGSGHNYINMDGKTGALVSISQPHHEIHEGNSFMLVQSTEANALDIAAPLTFHVVTPDSTKKAHMTFKIECSTQVLLEIFEDDGVAAHFDISAGDAATPLNHNRNSSNSSDLTVKTGVTVTHATADAKIYSRYVGGAGFFASAGDFNSREEIILKTDTEYLFRVTSIADNNEGSFELSWYEHTDKN